MDSNSAENEARAKSRNTEKNDWQWSIYTLFRPHFI